MTSALRVLLLALFSLLLCAQPAQAQRGKAGPLPELIANNQCEGSGPCVRQMLVYQQLEQWQQAALLGLLGVMPAAAPASKPSTSCSWHDTILICSHLSAEGSCACVITRQGGGCLGTHPGCPTHLP